MISPKQQKILAFPYSKYDALICDGAVRSGKTSIMMWAFVRWAMENFSGQRFGVCGRTVDSCTKNIIVPFTAMSLAKERYIWLVGDYSDKNGETNGGFIAIKLINALSTGGFQLQTSDKAKGQLAFEFTGHYSMSAQDAVPFEIYIKAGTEEA